MFLENLDNFVLEIKSYGISKDDIYGKIFKSEEIYTFRIKGSFSDGVYIKISYSEKLGNLRIYLYSKSNKVFFSSYEKNTIGQIIKRLKDGEKYFDENCIELCGMVVKPLWGEIYISSKKVYELVIEEYTVENKYTGSDSDGYRAYPDESNGDWHPIYDGFGTSYEKKKEVLREINLDIDTFSILNDNFARDNTHIFNRYGTLIDGVDMKSLVILGTNFLRDNNHVYSILGKIRDADINTIKLVNQDFLRDKDFVFSDRGKLSGVNPNNFHYDKKKYYQEISKGLPY